MRKETVTYQRLQLTLVKPGCPICGLAQDAVRTYLDTILWESSTDLNVHAILTASLGFCGRHSRELLTFGGQRLAAAVVERASLLAALHRLPDLAAAIPVPAPRRFRLWSAQPLETATPTGILEESGVQPCPACVRETQEAARGIETLLKHLDEFADPLRAAGGLCLPHFVQTNRLADAPARADLLAIQQQVWRVLVEDLEEFIRKHNDLHHTDPIRDAARLAVERTIAGLTGEYPVR